MQLAHIDIQNVRVLQDLQLELGPGINLFSGPNGSGKTSILEAVHILARAKSFRSPRLMEVVRHGEDSLTVSAKLKNGTTQTIPTGIERSTTGTVLRFNGDEVRVVSEQARNLPVLLLSPDSHSLLNGLPRERRRWLDWLMFHVEPTYLSIWNQYRKALGQRNKLLRINGRNEEIEPWEQAMASTTESLVVDIVKQISCLGTAFQEIFNDFLPGNAEIQYRCGWNKELTFLETLYQSRNTDRQRGFTQYGPHRGDVSFQVDGKEAAKTLSRGQSKLLMIALTLAQTVLIKQTRECSPILLMDDVAAELDNRSRQLIAETMEQSGIQCLVTMTEPNGFGDYCSNMFHVERGQAKKMVK